MRKRFAAGLAGLTLVLAAGCAIREPPPAAAPDAGAGTVRGPVEAGAHDVPVRPTLDASPTDLARFAEEVLVEAGVRGWALAVIHEGRPVERRFSAGVGGSVRTVDAGTMFDLQSVAKPVIAWGVMSLVEAGRVDLDQPIERYLSRWRLPPSDFDHRKVTVRRVLSHTAGLSWGRRQQFAAGEVLPPIEEALSGTDAEGRRLEVIVEPGTRFIYSSGGYTLLQLLIEEVSGRPFAEFMENEVLRPLGMHHSVFSPALPEAPVIGKMDALGRVAETDRVATASSLITSLEELTAFALAHLQGEPVGSRGRGVLRSATIDSMMAPVLAARNRRGLGYSVRRLDGDLLVAGHSGGGGDFRVVPETGDGLVILTNSTVGYFPIERIQCVWTGWLTGTDEGCPLPSSYALLGAYRRGGVAGALDYYEDLVDRADPDYLVGIEQLSDFARLFVGAGMDADAAAVYRYMSRSGTAEGAVYGEAADGLLSGHRVPEDRLPCYLGEYRSSSGDTIRLERAGAGLTVTIDPVAGIGGPVRILTDRVFLFDFGGFIGELVFDLAESGAAMRVMVRESAFGISLTAERSAADATADAGCAVREPPPAAASDADAGDLGAGNRVGSASGDPFDGVAATSAGADSVADSFVVAGGVRLHYLDFGGEGLPVVFVHSEAWDAHTYAEFAPRFADRNRVLAVTRPGYGDSEAHPDGFDVATQGRSLIDFLDALQIERAVFAGNASATAELTFLGEHHADRVAGLIYFTGLAVPWLEERDSDPTRAFEMFRRASPGAGDVAERVRARKAYRPELLRADRPTIGVPALAFVSRSGTKGNERGIGALALVGSPLMADVRSQMPPSPVRDHLERLAKDESYRTRQLEQIADPEAREYFLRLAADPELQERIYRYHEEVVLPALRAGQERFRHAFADDLRLVRLDVDQVVGYEYRDAPELVEPHVRRFLADLEPISEASRDTTRFTIIINGHRQGEWRMWQEAPDTWRYEHDGDAYHFPRTERLVLDSAGVPLAMEIDGQRIVWDRWVERYERSGGRARWTAHARSELGPEWSRALDEGEAEVSGPAYYAALHPVHDLGVLARLLLRRPGRTVPLLPDGTARLELVGERWVEVDGARRRIRLFAIHGLDLKPSYVWLDDDDATFADEWSVLAGWETVFPDLRSASDRALAEHHRRLARDLVPPARERPLVIRGARLFDPSTGQVTPGTTVVVEGSRISAVGSDGALDRPPGAEVVDAEGKTVLPGLWDMHAHHGFPGPYFELVAPLSLAGGITMARDLGMPTEPMLSLRRRIRASEAVGPRLLMAGWVGGAGGRPTGTLVSNTAEARAAVDRYAELGYVQIKIYSDLPHELVPVVIEGAKQHGLRVSGEIPTGMTAREAVAHGYEEIQHIGGLLLPLVYGVLTELSSQPTPIRLQALNEALAELTPDSEAVEQVIRLLASEGVAVDPTLTVFAAQGMEPPPWVARVADRFPFQARRRILDRHLFGYWPLTPLWDGIFGNMTALVGTLHEAGVRVLPGTDTEMAAFDLHQELALYVEAGIPAPEVITLATLGAARIMGMDDELGSIEPGKLADLILVDGDPTTDISAIRRVVTVIKDGRVYDPAAIYRALGVEPCCEPQEDGG